MRAVAGATRAAARALASPGARRRGPSTGPGPRAAGSSRDGRARVRLRCGAHAAVRNRALATRAGLAGRTHDTLAAVLAIALHTDRRGRVARHLVASLVDAILRIGPGGHTYLAIRAGSAGARRDAGTVVADLTGVTADIRGVAGFDAVTETTDLLGWAGDARATADANAAVANLARVADDADARALLAELIAVVANSRRIALELAGAAGVRKDPDCRPLRSGRDWAHLDCR